MLNKSIKLIIGLVFFGVAHVSYSSHIFPFSEPQINTKSYLLMDFDSENILTGHNVDTLVEPASLTKMMTIYVIDKNIQQGRLQPTDLVHISEKAWRTEGSRMFLEVGTKVPVSEIIQGIIISSANDGSVAIAEHIAGSEWAFADMMNSYANRLGMKNTHFKNSTGLPEPEHYSSARDIAFLAKALIQEFPNSYQVYAEKTYKYNNIKQYNRNRLLWRNPYVDGIKTGYSSSTGYCFVASAKHPKSGMRLISVVLGAESDNIRINEANKLLKWGFHFFETHKLYDSNKSLANIRVWSGKKKEISVGLKDDFYITIPRGYYKKLKSNIQIDQAITAPLKKGKILGNLSICINNKNITQRPIIALEDVERGGFFSRNLDRISIAIQSLKNKFHLS